MDLELSLPYYQDLELHFWKICSASERSRLRLALGYNSHSLVLAAAGVYLAVFGLERGKRLEQLPDADRREKQPEMKSLMRKRETTL